MHENNDDDRDYWKETEFVYGSGQLHPISVSPYLHFANSNQQLYYGSI